MGAGAGKNLVVGVPMNPRVELAEKESKKAGGWGEFVLLNEWAFTQSGIGSSEGRLNFGAVVRPHSASR